MTHLPLPPIAVATTIEAIAGDAVDRVVDAGFPRAGLYVERAKRLRCLAQRGFDQVHDGIPPQVGILGTTFARGEVTVVRDVSTDPRHLSVGDTTGAEVCIPLRYRNRVIGVLNIESAVGLTDDDLIHLMTIAADLEASIDAIGGPGSDSPWQALARETPDLATARDPGEILHLAVERAPGLAGTSSALIRRVEGGRTRTASWGPASPILDHLDDSQLDVVAGWTGGTVSVYTHGTPSTRADDAGLAHAGLRSWIAVPLRSGHPGDILLLADTAPIETDPTLVQVLEVYAAHVASALRMTDAFDELRFRARRDSVTGLEHASAFHDTFTALRAAPSSGLGIVLLDVDHLKRINDRDGHAVGDQVLRSMARRLEAAVGTHTLFRVGGDEFAVIVPADEPDDVAELAERLRYAARSERISVCVGVSHRTLDQLRLDGTHDHMLSEADLAVQAAKRKGRNRVEVFTAAMGAAQVDRARMTADLAQAIDNGELRMVYQPLVDTGRGTVIGAEALMRWCSPTRGNVGPDHFIPVAEESGQIIELGDWAIREVVRQAVAWDVSGRDLKIGVNVSGLQLRPAFVETVRALLESSGLEPARLVLELTESGLVDDDNRIKLIGRLRDLGVTVAIDDFGTGYSSLSYLRRLPIDILKIDRSFINELHDQRNAAVAKTIIDLTRTLSLDCVAEGIETPEQLSQLQALGCRSVQGYLFARPMEAGELLEFVAGFDARASVT